MLKQKSLKINIILTLFKTLMSLIFPLITFPYSSRILKPEGIGHVVFAQSIISYFSIIASLGIGTYAVRETAKVRDDKEKLNQLSKEIFTINLFSTGISYILLAFALIFVPALNSYRSLIIVISSSIIFTTIGMDWLYSGMEDYLYITIRSFIFQCFTVICLPIFVKDSDDYLQYALLSVISSVGSNICNLVHKRKYISFKNCSKLQIKKHLVPILILFANTIANSIYTMLDTSMLGIIAGDREVGLYSAASKINRIVLSMIISISTVILPRLSYYKNDSEDEEKYRNLLYESIDLLLMIAIPCVVGLEFLSKNIVLLLTGENYIDCVPAMRILNPMIYVVTIGNFIGVQIFIPNNKEKWCLFVESIAAVLNFILNFILIKKYGAYGAAVASVSAEFFVSVLSMILARKWMKISYIVRKSMLYFFDSAIMGFFVFLCQKFIKNILVSLIVGIVLGVVIYFILLLLEKNKILYSILKK